MASSSAVSSSEAAGRNARARAHKSCWQLAVGNLLKGHHVVALQLANFFQFDAVQNGEGTEKLLLEDQSRK